jgi:hypothetical protein
MKINISTAKWFGLIAAVIGITAFASIAAASLTFSGSNITGDAQGVVIDSSSTISIGTSTATGVTIGSPSSTVSFPGNVAVGGAAVGLSRLSIQSQSSFIIPNCTTMADATADIVGSGSGCAFTNQLTVGERISLSGDSSTWGTVSKIVSNSEVLLDSDWYGDSLGNGSAENITAYPSPFQLRSPFGISLLTTNDLGQIGIGSNDYTNTNIPAVPDQLSMVSVNQFMTGNLQNGINVFVQSNNEARGIRSEAAVGGSSANSFVTGSFSEADYSGSATATEILGNENHAVLEAGSTGNVVSAFGGVSDVSNFGAGTIQSGYGWRIQSPQGSGPIANLYGLFVEDQSRGTNNYAIKTGKGKVELGDVFQIDPGTFSSLPTCNSGEEGTQHPVTDAPTSTIGATISTGSGSNHVLAYCDGTNWTVMAK